VAIWIGQNRVEFRCSGDSSGVNMCIENWENQSRDLFRECWNEAD
jgi:hypothetical protein